MDGEAGRIRQAVERLARRAQRLRSEADALHAAEVQRLLDLPDAIRGVRQ